MTEKPPLPDWPRLLSRPLAAAYCGISDKHVPVDPLHLGGRVVWDRNQVDAWIDTLSTDKADETDWRQVMIDTLTERANQRSKARRRKPSKTASE